MRTLIPVDRQRAVAASIVLTAQLREDARS
jgi:hypothetical protein